MNGEDKSGRGRGVLAGLRVAEAALPVGKGTQQVAFARRYVQRREVGAREGAVGRPVERQGMSLDHAAVGREDVNGRAGTAGVLPRRGDDIAVRVQHHTVYAAMLSEVV